jgi:hypothetical protein
VPPGLGLALFLNQGMAAWAEAWSQCTDARSAEPGRLPERGVPTAAVAELVHVLAGMALQSL